MILYGAVGEKYQLPVKQTTTYKDQSGAVKKFVNDTATYGDGTHYWNLNIRTEAGVKKSSDPHDYIPVIKQWMTVLYKADYKWYFELHDAADKEKCYFTLYPGDNGFDKTEDWDDDYLYQCILSNMES